MTIRSYAPAPFVAVAATVPALIDWVVQLAAAPQGKGEGRSDDRVGVVVKGIDVTRDAQHTVDPGYNRDRRPANVLAPRVHGAL